MASSNVSPSEPAGGDPKRPATRSAVPGLLLGAAVVVCAIVLVLKSDVGAPPVVRGTQAPDFTLPRWVPEDEAALPPMTLSDFEGRVVLLNFWATWCLPCESEMPAMERLYAAMPRDAFELIAVSIDEQPSEVADFQDRYHLSFPILLDTDQATYETYQAMGVPESLLVDPEGRIIERYVGPRAWDSAEYEQRLRSLIAASAGERPAVPPPSDL